MAKREQVVEVAAVEEQAVEEQAVEETVRSIAQAQAEYEQLMEEIRGYCQQAKDLREQAAELRRSGRKDSQVGAEIRQLLDQAEQLEILADQKDGHPRLEALRYIEDLQREATALRGTVQHNQSVLARQQKELEEAKEEAAAMFSEQKNEYRKQNVL
ncbi:hypothetical protein O0550_23685 [Brevibacillus halotolerans]|uniref:hypothetical protein n=1 Tax=Brevibacillus TaxID=55080 RepID=UPI00215B84DB|nr:MULTISPECIES: hypothetical protein [Brevibacillus]MCR8966148.1 hypothetical protein [Brevibacillus laterosporus]MCZ0838305.1 hypothetical protein [Brevibacillus halotolerans]